MCMDKMMKLVHLCVPSLSVMGTFFTLGYAFMVTQVV